MSSSSSSGPSGSGPPPIPKRTSSKRARSDLQKDYKRLQLDLELAKREVRPSTSFDARYWTSAAAACGASVECLHAEAKLAVQDWVDNGEGPAASWWATNEARRIIEQIKAATLEKSLYTKQAERVSQGGPIRRAFQAMFTTSQLGICADKVGMGARQRSEQAKFKDDLIQFYGAATTKPNKPKVIISVHDTATGYEFLKPHVTAAHLFPHNLGPDVLVSLFGEDVEGELMTARNGLLLQPDVESALDDGAIAIVPDLPDDPTTEQVADWERKEPKNYRWRIIDEDAESLETVIALESQGAPKNMTVRDLDGLKLSFKNDNRPRARYLYFLFVVAQLKMAWRHEYRKDPAKKLKPQLGKGFWATRGRYLNRGLLLALAEEIGHDTSFPENIPPLPGTDHDTQPQRDEDGDGEAGLIAIAKIIAAQRRGDEEEDEEEE
ncbi:HNH nuclease domain-containing protein [Madurella fahalii]|uniref:HNH nuclease domain-containing protein n=1 Tax=Madurella fahalii TaxID=1157608 RepID=A0ABQ0GGY5_9PEZI